MNKIEAVQKAVEIMSKYNISQQDIVDEYHRMKRMKKTTKCFSVNSRDVSDQRKNPGLKLSAQSILRNNRIQKKKLS